MVLVLSNVPRKTIGVTLPLLGKIFWLHNLRPQSGHVFYTNAETEFRSEIRNEGFQD